MVSPESSGYVDELNKKAGHYLHRHDLVEIRDSVSEQQGFQRDTPAKHRTHL